MQSPNTWRELLGTIISDPQEERRLIDLMGIRPITLLRWVQNKTEPRPYFLRQLLDALPQYRDSLLPLMEKEFPGVSGLVEDEVPKEIAASFYTHVLETYVATPPSLRFWSICPLILQHILEHLDPEQRGMELLVVRCMPPAGQDQKIHSLREYVALGTPPWQTDLEERNLFLGAESLAGYAVSSCHTAVIQNLQQDHRLASHIAGCLLVSSTQPQYFHRPRLAVLKQYTNLLVLAFQTEEFYDPALIELHMMPSQRMQQPYFATLRQRVADVLAQARARQQSLTSQQAEHLARQQLEQELLQISL